jgi:hypothetical protein
MKRRTEITIEIDRVIVISQQREQRSWCATCGADVLMVTAGEAAEMIHESDAVIYRLAESGKLHFATTTAGMLLICPDSLLALLDNEPARPSSQRLICERTTCAD